MIRIKTSIIALFSLALLVSCSQKSENYIHIFYNAKYGLKNAAYNDTYIVSSEPAYFNQIDESDNCLDLFDLDNCYCSYKTVVAQNKPKGEGEINISFKETSLDSFHWEFEYFSEYDRGYGGRIQIVGEAEYQVGIQYVRGKYWWVRMDCTFPQLNNKRVILQFGVSEVYEDLDEFDGNTIFS